MNKSYKTPEQELNDPEVRERMAQAQVAYHKMADSMDKLPSPNQKQLPKNQ